MLISYEQAQYLKRLVDDNYKNMTSEDYIEIKTKIEKIASDKLDYIVKKALEEL